MHQPQSFSHVVAFGMSSRPAAGVTHALFAHRVRAKCARHGCDSDSFFDLLRTRGFTAETVELDADTAALAQRAAAVTTKSPQAIIVTKVFRAPGP